MSSTSTKMQQAQAEILKKYFQEIIFSNVVLNEPYRLLFLNLKANVLGMDL